MGGRCQGELAFQPSSLPVFQPSSLPAFQPPPDGHGHAHGHGHGHGQGSSCAPHKRCGPLAIPRGPSYLHVPSCRLSGKKAKKGKKGKGKGNGKKPHIKTIDGVNPGGWLDGAQGSSEWDEDLQAIDDVTGDYVHDPFIDDVTGDYVAPPDDSD